MSGRGREGPGEKKACSWTMKSSVYCEKQTNTPNYSPRGRSKKVCMAYEERYLYESNIGRRFYKF